MALAQEKEAAAGGQDPFDDYVELEIQRLEIELRQMHLVQTIKRKSGFGAVLEVFRRAGRAQNVEVEDSECDRKGLGV